MIRLIVSIKCGKMDQCVCSRILVWCFWVAFLFSPICRYPSGSERTRPKFSGTPEVEFRPGPSRSERIPPDFLDPKVNGSGVHLSRSEQSFLCTPKWRRSEWICVDPSGSGRVFYSRRWMGTQQIRADPSDFLRTGRCMVLSGPADPSELFGPECLRATPFLPCTTCSSKKCCRLGSLGKWLALTDLD